MRGFDYTTTALCGFALLLAAPLDSKREVEQALGRVGRYGTPCKRFILKGLVPVNAAM